MIMYDYVCCIIIKHFNKIVYNNQINSKSDCEYLQKETYNFFNTLDCCENYHYDVHVKTHDNHVLIIKMSLDEFKNILIKKFCDGCKKTITIDYNICEKITCDFCNKTLCIECKELEYTTFVKCDTCGATWCQYDGLHSDYKCNKCSSHGLCIDCGN